MLLGALRGGNPHERVVGVPSLCCGLVEFFNSTGWAFYGKLACCAFTRCWPTPEEHIPTVLDRV